MKQATKFASGTIEVTFGVGTLNVGTEREFSVSTRFQATVYDTGTATLAGGGTPTPTPTPDPEPAPTPAADSSTEATLAKTGSELSLVVPIVAALLLAAVGATLLVRRRRA